MNIMNSRYIYDYYKYGGFYPWLSKSLLGISIPIFYGSMIGYLFFMFIPDYILTLSLLAIPVTKSIHCLFIFLRRLPGMLFARKIFNDINIPDPLIKCTQWPNIAIKLTDKKYFSREREFGSLQASLDCLIIDLYLAGICPTDITDTGIQMIKSIIHRSLRANYHCRYSIIIQCMIEIILLPYNIFSRFLEIALLLAPKFYKEPGSLITRAFRPSIKYRFRGYYELEFDTDAKIMSLEGTARKFLNEFPGQGLEIISEWLSGISGVPLIYFLISWNLQGIIILSSILYIIHSLSPRVSGSYNPGPLYKPIADRFELPRDSPESGLEFLSKEMPRFLVSLFFNMISIIFAPVYCLHFLGIAEDIQSVISKKVVNDNGSPGVICSQREYNHIAFSDPDEGNQTDYLNDQWLSRSTMDFEKEYADILSRATGV